MRIPGGSGARNALEGMGRRLTRLAHTPVLGLVIIAALIVVGVVGAAPGPATLGYRHVSEAIVRPLAAVADPSGDESGAAVVAVTRAPMTFHVAAATISAPPPSVVVNSPGALKIPAIALAAYRNAERLMAAADPACGVSWNLLAGIGRIESMHANGGATDARGTALRPIVGPVLDGSVPGNEIIVAARTPAGVQYARALGPMQFLPGTWSRFASDGYGDGIPDVQNIFDASLAAARYLCSGGLNLRDPGQVMAAILRYNNSFPYALNVLGWAAAYATGVVPVDLPPITGPIPPMGDAHFEGTGDEGLGPGLPINAIGLPPTDPLSLLPVQFGVTDAAGQLATPSWALDPTAQVAGVAPTGAPDGGLYGPVPGPAPDAPPGLFAPGPAAPPPGPPPPAEPPWGFAPPPAEPTTPLAPALPPAQGPLPGPVN